MTARPWMKFYPSDWKGDTKLKLVSMAARGLWMEMICIMHEAERYGELTVAGVAIDAEKLARIVGEHVSNVDGWLDELKSAGVYSVKKNGVIYSRRMERDENKRRKLVENGKKGGNPTLCNQTQNDTLDNQPDKPIETRDQRPETRIKKEPKGSEKKIDHSLLFERFWSEYPRKVARGHAEKAFPKALKEASFEEIMSGVRRYAAAMQGREKTYIKHGASWLNGKCWTDVPDDIAPQSVQRNTRYSMADAYIKSEMRNEQPEELVAVENPFTGELEYHAQ